MTDDGIAEALPSSPAAWAGTTTDANLVSSLEPGGPSMSPAGENLDLAMGWDRFEKLVLALFTRTLGARDVKFRRYGTAGQAQHGIDLVGRLTDGLYTVVQCKEYRELSPTDLRAAVKTFTEGRRPFGATTFIVVTSASTRNTQLNDELATIQKINPDLTIDLWGREHLNDELRNYADIVARFWTRETASTFCTGAPAPGVPAPPPDRQEQAERILLGPLDTTDVALTLRAAEAAQADDPSKAAELFGQVAERLAADGFVGHSLLLRRRQLDAMAAASMAREAAALAGELVTAALMSGNRFAAREVANLAIGPDSFTRQLGAAPSDDTDTSDRGTAARRRHNNLIAAALGDTVRVVGAPVGLLEALRPVVGLDDPGYHPKLVLYLAEDLFAADPAALTEVTDLVDSAIEQARQAGMPSMIGLRLQLVRAEYDKVERRELLNSARRHRVPGWAVALINAREARRCALEGRADDASLAWREAIQEGIHGGFTDDAADWLYAIRLLNLRYGPWTVQIDDEQRLAEALRGTSSHRIIDRGRDPSNAAMSAVLDGRPREAVVAARRWLIDSCVAGAWADEQSAAELLGDIYADNLSPSLAAVLYQRVGASDKVTKVAGQVGDVLLPTSSWAGQPWWVAGALAAQVSVQEDLLDEQVAEERLDELIDLVHRCQMGELTDSPPGSLMVRSVKSACNLGARGTARQAQEVLELLALTVERDKNRYFPADEEHAAVCVGIALAHPTVAYTALSRLVKLAAFDTQPAQNALVRDEVVALLKEPKDDLSSNSSSPSCLTVGQRTSLHERIVRMAEDDCYLADVLLGSIDPKHPLVQERASAAREAILSRPEPDPHGYSHGTTLVSRAYLASLLPVGEAHDCLEKLVAVASDTREAATNRKEALRGARNLVSAESADGRSVLFERTRSFVVGDCDGSAFDEFAGKSHPLDALRFDMGTVSLRGEGLLLAREAAEHSEQYDWIRDQAVEMLRSADKDLIHAAALVINALPSKITDPVDAELLAASDNAIVRQVAAFLSARTPERYSGLLVHLASDADHRVRRALAEGIARSTPSTVGPLAAAQKILEKDPRHSIRVALSNRR